MSLAEAANRSLKNRVAAYTDMMQVLENELDEKELALNAEQRVNLVARKKYKAKIEMEKEKVANELAGKFAEREKAIKNLFIEDTGVDGENNEPNLKTVSDPNLSSVARNGQPRSRRMSTSPQRSVAVSRNRRSRSTDADKWLDHRPKVGGPVASNTVLQPVLKNRRSVSKLETADLNTPSKYVLSTATQGVEGDVETRLYKGDVLSTVGGGKQVVFNDVEVLTQESPRKRSYEEFRGIGDRIADLKNRGIDGGLTPVKGKRSRV